MLNNNSWKPDEAVQTNLAQRRRQARRTALIAGVVALMFYTGFMLLGLLNQ